MLKSLNFISVRWCLYQVPIFRNKKKKRTIQPHNKINFLWELHFINNEIWSSTIHFSKSKAIPDVKHVTVFTLICKNKKITRKIQSHLYSFNIAITIYFYHWYYIFQLLSFHGIYIIILAKFHISFLKNSFLIIIRRLENS